MATTAAGIEAARELDELYRSHAAEVFRYAYAVLGNRADAEDVTQTTFINALRALERGERPHTPKNWLITIAHNLIRQRFRQQQSRPRHVELDEQLPAAEAADDDGPSLDDLVSALQRIPPTQREALVLRELEGRSYIEIAELLGISQSALETLIFRARRSLAEELENLVTCAAAELALSRATDGRLGRKERRRLRAHLDECASCARTATRSLKYRRAFKTLAVLPLPFSLTLFKGAPTASAAVGLPTIGAGAAAGTAAGVGAAGVTTKIAVGLAAVAVAGGAGYEGVKAVQKPTTQAPPPANVVHAPIPRASEPTLTSLSRTPAAKPERVVAKPSRAKPATSATRERGRSATAPGHVKPKPEKNAKAMPARSPRADGGAKEKGSMAAPPAVEADRGKSAAAPARARVQATPKPVKPANPVKPVESAKAPKSARAAKPKPEKAPQAQAAKAQQAAKPQKAKGAEQPQQASAEQARPPKS